MILSLLEPENLLNQAIAPEKNSHPGAVVWDRDPLAESMLLVHHRIEAQARLRPEAIAVQFGQHTLSYRQLNQQANQLAHDLIAQGSLPGSVVGVCLQPCLEVAVALLAIFKAGCIYVPLEVSYPLQRLEAIVADTRPSIILTQTELLPKLRQIPSAPVLWDLNRPLLPSQPIAASPFAPPFAPPIAPPVNIAPDQLAYILYTSGTTGKPKGVMVSHANLGHYIFSALHQYQVRETDWIPAIARFSFSISLFELLLPLVAGARLEILSREQILDFDAMAQGLTRFTLMHTSPSWMRQFLAHRARRDLASAQCPDLSPDLSLMQLRHVSCGGDMVSRDLLKAMRQAFPSAEVGVIYGCSEVSCMACTHLFAPNVALPSDASRDGANEVGDMPQHLIGRPFANVEVRLYDPDQNLVPVGGVGEIYIGGNGVSVGYLHQPELSSEKFVEIDGMRFYRTGDLGRCHQEGYLEILGRLDFQIQLRGIRIEPAEIELALRQVPGVEDAVVSLQWVGEKQACEKQVGEKALDSGVPSDESTAEKSLIAYLVLDSQTPAAIAEVRQALQMQLPEYMIPAGFVVLEALPLNHNFKVDRRALPHPTAQNLAGLDLPAPPRDAIESELINIWQQVLGISPIGIYNSFFELGGDSLLAVQVLTQIEQRFEIALSISTPLAAPDIASLAELIRQGGDRQTNRDVVLLRPSQHPSTQHPSIPAPSPQHSSTQAPANVFCLYGLLLYRDLAACLPPHVNVYGVCLQEEIALLQQGNVAQMSQIFSSVEQITDRYVAAIQAVQPHGPYWFVGESFGGIIAYEVARRLTACGESVELVAMLDTYVTTVFDLSRVERLRHHAQALIAEGPHYIQVKVQRRWLQLRSRLAKLRASRAKFSPLSPSSSPQQNSQDLDDIRELARTQALHRYFPSRYEGKVLLLRAQDRERFSTADPTLGWGPFAPQLLLGEVPGDHLGILKPPHVQALAAQVNPHLPQARLLGPVGGIVESRVTPPQGDRRLAGPRLASIESDALELPPLQSAPLESAPL